MTPPNFTLPDPQAPGRKRTKKPNLVLLPEWSAEDWAAIRNVANKIRTRKPKGRK